MELQEIKTIIEQIKNLVDGASLLDIGIPIIGAFISWWLIQEWKLLGTPANPKKCIGKNTP